MMGLFSGKRRRSRRGQPTRRQAETIDQAPFIYGDFGSGYDDRRSDHDSRDDRSHYGEHDPRPFSPSHGDDHGSRQSDTSHHGDSSGHTSTDSGGSSDGGGGGGGGGGD